MTAPIDRSRIFSHLTKTRFLHIEDSLDRRKLRFFIGSFERGQGANNTAYAFLDVDDARVVMNDLAWGKTVDFIDHKGGKDDSGAVISRVLKIVHAPTHGPVDTKVWIEVQNGVGEALFEGAIKPKGKAWAEISIPLTVFEARKMGFACLAYLQAWENSVYHKGH
jgi:streptomycin 6-kinase